MTGGWVFLDIYFDILCIYIYTHIPAGRYLEDCNSALTLPETNIFAHEPMDGWKKSKYFLLGWFIFRCELLVSGSVNILIYIRTFQLGCQMVAFQGVNSPSFRVSHLPFVPYIFGTKGLVSFLIYWQLGALFQIYRELEDEGIPGKTLPPF